MSENISKCVEFIISETKMKEFECDDKAINEYMKENKLFPSSKQKVIVFDLHNVLDVINNTTSLGTNDKMLVVCCSFIGYRNEKLKSKARKDILARIDSGQINYGILVFKRGKRKRKTKMVGSKAWFCKLVNCNIFFDDGVDHIESVKEFTSSEAFLIERGIKEEKLVEFIKSKIKTLTGGKSFYRKYLKYKMKYLALKNLLKY